MLQNVRVTAYTVSELLRKNQQRSKLLQKLGLNKFQQNIYLGVSCFTDMLLV